MLPSSRGRRGVSARVNPGQVGPVQPVLLGVVLVGGGDLEADLRARVLMIIGRASRSGASGVQR